jgi:hypothetical protein
MALLEGADDCALCARLFLAALADRFDALFQVLDLALHLFRDNVFHAS